MDRYSVAETLVGETIKGALINWSYLVFRTAKDELFVVRREQQYGEEQGLTNRKNGAFPWSSFSEAELINAGLVTAEEIAAWQAAKSHTGISGLSTGNGASTSDSRRSTLREGLREERGHFDLGRQQPRRSRTHPAPVRLQPLRGQHRLRPGLIAVAFRVPDSLAKDAPTVPVRLQVETRQVYDALYGQPTKWSNAGRVLDPKGYQPKGLLQAERVAWRHLVLWVDAALSAAAAGAQKISEAFLAHTLIRNAEGRTVRVVDQMDEAAGGTWRALLAPPSEGP
jgi:hypothetical protein